MMMTNFWTRRRTKLDREIEEPTLLAIVLIVTGIILLLGGGVQAINFLPVLGHIWWAFAAIAGILAGLVLSLRRKAGPQPLPATGRQRWFGGILALARLLFIGVLTCWLGLIVWLEWCPGGAVPPAKTDSALIRVLTWNIHCGQDEGLPWQRFDWPVRKHALRAALEQAKPDILCVQEATTEQVKFLEGVLPGQHRVGVGRDDGKSSGEHCAIYFSRERFEEIASNTFWLEEPIDEPRVATALDIKRICTWVRLRDRVSGHTLRVYNTHLYLTETARWNAAQIILAQIAAGDPTDAVLLTADFNASPAAPSRRIFGEAGFMDSAQGGKNAGAPTFQLYGMGMWCLDGILVDRRWRVHHHFILDVKPGNTFPSDHFGVLADIAVQE